MAKSRIAELYVQLVPAMEGFFQKFNRDLATNMPGAGGSAGKSFGGAFGGSMSKVISFAKVGAGLATALAGVTAGFIAKGGISRALNIEDAEAKLKGLKYNAGEIAKISESAMAAVNGTSYSFDQAMSVAASSLASGITAGDDLTKYLKLVGDGATVSGASLNEMGYIFNKIQGNGVAFMEELNMMSDRGLPIFSWLAKEAGMSVADLRKEISKGTVTAEMFRKAVEVNIGGAATSAAKTTRGMAANTQAAMARLGAAQYGGVLPIIKNTLEQTIPIIDAMTNAAKTPAAAFWKSAQERFDPKFAAWSASMVAAINGGGGLFPAFDRLNQVGASSLDWIQNLFGTVQASPFGAFFQEAIGNAQDFIGNLKPIGAIWQDSILPGLLTFWGLAKPILEQVATNMQSLFTTLAPVLGALFTQIGPLIGMIGKTVMEVYGIIQSQFAPLMVDFIGSLGGAIMTILPQIIEFATMLIGIIGPLFQQFAPMLATAMTQIFDVVGQIIAAVFPVVAQLLPIIGSIIQSLLPVIMVLAQVIFDVVGKLLTTLGPAIAGILTIVGQLVVTLGSLLGPIIKELSPVFEELVKVIEPVAKLLGSIIELVLAIAGPVLVVLFEVILTFLPLIIGAIKMLVGFLTTAIKFVVAIFAEVANIIIRLWNMIADVLNSVKIDVPDWVQELTGMGPEMSFNVQKVSLADVPVPELAKGANVMPRKGGTLAILAEAGRAETVTDFGNTNAMIQETRALVQSVSSQTGSTIGETHVQVDVHAAPGMDPKELMEAAYKAFRRNGRLV